MHSFKSINNEDVKARRVGKIGDVLNNHADSIEELQQQVGYLTTMDDKRRMQMDALLDGMAQLQKQVADLLNPKASA